MTDTNSNEPIKFKTTNGHSVTLRPFVPPRMANETRAVFLRYARLNKEVLGDRAKDISTDDIDFKDGIPAEIINEINEITMRRMVMEIDGKTGEEALNYMLDDIRQVDNNEIVLKCNEISKATSVNAEKKST